MVQKWYWGKVVYPWVLSISPIYSPGLGEWWGENSLECNIKFITSNRWREYIISWRKLLWNRSFWQATIMIIREESLYRFLQCCPINDPRHHKAWPTIRWIPSLFLKLLLSFSLNFLSFEFNLDFAWPTVRWFPSLLLKQVDWNVSDYFFFQEMHLRQLSSSSDCLGCRLYHP